MNNTQGGAELPGVAFRSVDLWALLDAEQPSPAALQSEAGRPDRWRLDAARVARDRFDMEAHTVRVLLQCQRMPGDAMGQRVRLFQALIDLFLALGVQGPELRAGLLARAHPHLAPDQHAFLARHLATGLRSTDALPAGTNARLDAGLLGRIDLVVRRPAPPPQQRPAVQEAIDLVDRGDDRAAQAVLEAALLDDPHDAEVAEELRQLYQLNGDEHAAQAMADRLRERGLPVPADWANV